MAWKKSVALRSCCCPAYRLRISATAPICRTILCPAAPTPCSRAFRISFRSGARCWAVSGGSRIVVKKSPRRTARKKEARNEELPQRDQVVQLLEAGAVLRSRRRLLRSHLPVLLRTRPFHPPDRRIPLGNLGRL